MRKRNWGIKFACFLTGYNYEIVNDCSQVTLKIIKQYLSAMLIIATMWGFIGYNFTERYLRGELWHCIFGTLIMIFIIVQIERIIIHIGEKNKGWALGSRLMLGFLMAFIGSIILDQILFKEDIEINKITEMIKKNSDLIQALQAQKKGFSNKIGSFRNKDLMTKLSTTTYSKDEGTDYNRQTAITTKFAVNPKYIQIEKDANENKKQIQKQIDEINEKNKNLEKEKESRTGMIDELNRFFKIMSSSWKTIVVGIIFFSFCFIIEFLVLAIKLTTNNEKNDYNETLTRQMETRIQRLNNLGKT